MSECVWLEQFSAISAALVQQMDSYGNLCQLFATLSAALQSLHLGLDSAEYQPSPGLQTAEGAGDTLDLHFLQNIRPAEGTGGHIWLTHAAAAEVATGQEDYITLKEEDYITLKEKKY